MLLVRKRKIYRFLLGQVVETRENTDHLYINWRILVQMVAKIGVRHPKSTPSLHKNTNLYSDGIVDGLLRYRNESFNAKVKAFRSQFRGVRDISFFIFRLAKIFA